MLFRYAATYRGPAIGGPAGVAHIADPAGKTLRQPAAGFFPRLRKLQMDWPALLRRLRDRRVTIAVAGLIMLLIYWFAGDFRETIQWIGAHKKDMACPAYGTSRAAAGSPAARAKYSDNGCVSFCTADVCGPPFCELYVVHFGGRSGNAFIQMAVGLMLARRRGAAFISPPAIDGFGPLPAVVQASCPLAADSGSVWPTSWHSPWAFKVRAVQLALLALLPSAFHVGPAVGERYARAVPRRQGSVGSVCTPTLLPLSRQVIGEHGTGPMRRAFAPRAELATAPRGGGRLTLQDWYFEWTDDVVAALRDGWIAAAEAAAAAEGATVRGLIGGAASAAPGPGPATAVAGASSAAAPDGGSGGSGSSGGDDWAPHPLLPLDVVQEVRLLEGAARREECEAAAAAVAAAVGGGEEGGAAREASSSGGGCERLGPTAASLGFPAGLLQPAVWGRTAVVHFRAADILSNAWREDHRLRIVGGAQPWGDEMRLVNEEARGRGGDSGSAAPLRLVRRDLRVTPLSPANARAYAEWLELTGAAYESGEQPDWADPRFEESLMGAAERFPFTWYHAPLALSTVLAALNGTRAGGPGVPPGGGWQRILIVTESPTHPLIGAVRRAFAGMSSVPGSPASLPVVSLLSSSAARDFATLLWARGDLLISGSTFSWVAGLLGRAAAVHAAHAGFASLLADKDQCLVVPERLQRAALRPGSALAGDGSGGKRWVYHDAMRVAAAARREELRAHGEVAAARQDPLTDAASAACAASPVAAAGPYFMSAAQLAAFYRDPACFTSVTQHLVSERPERLLPAWAQAQLRAQAWFVPKGSVGRALRRQPVQAEAGAVAAAAATAAAAASAEGVQGESAWPQLQPGAAPPLCIDEFEEWF